MNTLNPYEKQLIGTWQYDFDHMWNDLAESDKKHIQKVYGKFIMEYKQDKTYIYKDSIIIDSGTWEITKKNNYLYLNETPTHGNKKCYIFYEPIKDKLILLLCNGEGNQRIKRIN